MILRTSLHRLTIAGAVGLAWCWARNEACATVVVREIGLPVGPFEPGNRLGLDVDIDGQRDYVFESDGVTVSSFRTGLMGSFLTPSLQTSPTGGASLTQNTLRSLRRRATSTTVDVVAYSVAGATISHCLLPGCATESLLGEVFLGLEFEGGGQTHYGWVFLDSYARGALIIRVAYESEAGVAIQVPIPEPGGAALLLTGNLIFALRRRMPMYLREDKCLKFNDGTAVPDELIGETLAAVESVARQARDNPSRSTILSE